MKMTQQRFSSNGGAADSCQSVHSIFNMRGFAVVRTCALLILGLSFVRVQGNAQSLIFSVTTSANSITVSNAVTYTINLTNQTGLVLQNVSVTNSPSSPVFGSVLTNSQGTASTNSASIVFDLGTLERSEERR